MKPLFGDKGGIKQKIVLVEGDRIINEDAELAQTFNDFFDTLRCVTPVLNLLIAKLADIIDDVT